MRKPEILPPTTAKLSTPLISNLFFRRHLRPLAIPLLIPIHIVELRKHKQND